MNAPVAIAPIVFSDRTSMQVVGLPWRVVQSFCHAHDVPIRKVGRRPVVVVAAFLAALEGDAKAPVWDEAAAVLGPARGR